MQFVLKRLSDAHRSGAALILMVLLIVVFGALLWLGIDPMTAFFRDSSAGMPWEDEFRLVRTGEEVAPPGEGQPEILDNLVFRGSIRTRNDDGLITLYLLTDGRIKGNWGGKFRPKPNIMWEVVAADFKGNIDPSKTYIDENGEDPTKLYLIAKGGFLILETNSETDMIRKATGNIYITGWLDDEYKAVGKLFVTSDKKNYWEYDWQSAAEEALMIPDSRRSLPGLF